MLAAVILAAASVPAVPDWRQAHPPTASQPQRPAGYSPFVLSDGPIRSGALRRPSWALVLPQHLPTWTPSPRPACVRA